MEDPSKKAPPKYMNMQGSTLFEMAQSIDNAINAAEQTVAHDQQDTCYQIWFEQLVDQLQDEFSFTCDVARVDNANAMCTEFAPLLERSKLQFKLMLKEGASQESFQLALRMILERALMDTFDLMHAQTLWRFDLQRKMQTTQERLLGAIYQLDY